LTPAQEVSRAAADEAASSGIGAAFARGAVRPPLCSASSGLGGARHGVLHGVRPRPAPQQARDFGPGSARPGQPP